MNEISLQSDENKSDRIKEYRKSLRSSIKSTFCLTKQHRMSQPVGGDRDQLSYLSLKLKATMNQTKQTKLFEDCFELKEKIGQGTQSIVYKCVKKQTNQQYAVKVLATLDEQIVKFVQRQYQIIEKLSHQNIIKVKNIHINQNVNKTYIIYQYYDFENLGEFSLKNKMSQQQIRHIICSILQAVQYIHSHNISHRDIKPDNILYCPKSKQIKIIDFENSKEKNNNDGQINFMWTNTGDRYYKAPQMFGGSYNELIDIWAIGVIAYQLGTGKLPFCEQYLKDLEVSIRYKEPQYSLTNMSSELINFIKKCLVKDPKDRMSAKEALQVQFIQKDYKTNILQQTKNNSHKKNEKVNDSSQNKYEQVEQILFFNNHTQQKGKSIENQLDSLF